MKVYLKSGGNSALSRYDILAEEPHTIIDAHGFSEIAQWLNAHTLSYDGQLPFVGGLIGSLDYGWPKPRAWLIAPQKITIWDHVAQRACVVRIQYAARCSVEVRDIAYHRCGSCHRGAVSLARMEYGSYRGIGYQSSARRQPLGATHTPLKWTPAISQQDYLSCIQKILQHIRDGNIYQANFAQTFTAPFAGDSYTFWENLFVRNPAAFFAYIDTGTQQILSTSPELLLRQRGTHVESRPIKGTRPRGRTESEDARLRAELLASEKEGAELAMIVDLVRNDLHRSCVTGSVQVRHHRVIEAYQNVFHQISVVTGQLASPQTNIATLQHLFPGGSITGCPKIRAMEIIEELEGRPRGIYTGSIGYASLHGTQDWNIAIRTATVQDGIMSLSVGGGIVADSDPEQEYEETLHKAATFFRQ